VPSEIGSLLSAPFPGLAEALTGAVGFAWPAADDDDDGDAEGEALSFAAEGDGVPLSDGDTDASEADGDADGLADGVPADALVAGTGTAARTSFGAAPSRVGLS
jgi:hypothetical protein